MTQPAANLFPLLLGFAFRSIGFPCSETKLEVRQDLVIHKFADRDGAHDESTGRHPFQITARIPFINGLQRVHPGVTVDPEPGAMVAETTSTGSP